MLRHANQTSFKPGNKWTEESKKKRKATILAKNGGKWPAPLPPGYKFSAEVIAQRAVTRRMNILGKRRQQSGYWQIMTMDGYRYEHRVVMERILGRKLLRAEIVHHINHDKLDNRPENLELTSPGEHAKRHWVDQPDVFRRAQKAAAAAVRNPPGRWAHDYDRCIQCQCTDSDPASHGVCHRCYERNRRVAKKHL